MISDLKAKTEEVDAIIRRYLPKEEGVASSVMEAMNYSVNVGGKRIRPMLMMEVYRMFEGDPDEEILHRFMAAIEMIHTYSLCHDDLPAMDNDAFRRGKPSTHAKFGEAMGILAGDALLNYAIEICLECRDCEAILTRRHPYSGCCEFILKALCILTRKSGIYGMIAGQVADMEAENSEPGAVTLDLIRFIHEHKTAAMIESSLMIGATLAGAGKEHTKTLEQIGSDVGLAFQIRDDILDITGGEQLGKPVGSDERNGKVTYVSLVGLKKAREDVLTLTDCAVEKLLSLPGSDSENGKFLIGLVKSLAERDR